MLVYSATGLLAIPFWDWVAKRFGKHLSLATAMVLVSIVPTAVFVFAFYLCVTWPLTDHMHEKLVRILGKRYARQMAKG